MEKKVAWAMRPKIRLNHFYKKLEDSEEEIPDTDKILQTKRRQSIFRICRKLRFQESSSNFTTQNGTNDPASFGIYNSSNSPSDVGKDRYELSAAKARAGGLDPSQHMPKTGNLSLSSGCSDTSGQVTWASGQFMDSLILARKNLPQRDSPSSSISHDGDSVTNQETVNCNYSTDSSADCKEAAVKHSKKLRGRSLTAFRKDVSFNRRRRVSNKKSRNILKNSGYYQNNSPQNSKGYSLLTGDSLSSIASIANAAHSTFIEPSGSGKRYIDTDEKIIGKSVSNYAEENAVRNVSYVSKSVTPDRDRKKRSLKMKLKSRLTESRLQGLVISSVSVKKKQGKMKLEIFLERSKSVPEGSFCSENMKCKARKRKQNSLQSTSEKEISVKDSTPSLPKSHLKRRWLFPRSGR